MLTDVCACQIPIELVGKSDFEAWVKAQDLRTTTLLKFQVGRPEVSHPQGSKQHSHTSTSQRRCC